MPSRRIRLVIGTCDAHVERMRPRKLPDLDQKLIGPLRLFQRFPALHGAVGRLRLRRFDDRDGTDPDANAGCQYCQADDPTYEASFLKLISPRRFRHALPREARIDGLRPASPVI